MQVGREMLEKRPPVGYMQLDTSPFPGKPTGTMLDEAVSAGAGAVFQNVTNAYEGNRICP